MTDKQPEPATAAAMPARGRNWTHTLLWIAGPALVLSIGGWLYVTSGRYAATKRKVAPPVGHLADRPSSCPGANPP